MAANNSDGSDISVSDDSDGNEYNLNNIPNYPPPNNYASSSDEDEFLNFHPGWVEDGFNPRRLRDYMEVPGSVVDNAIDTPPVMYFQLFWDQAMWDRLVEETNHYAEQERRKNPPGPRAPNWREVDERSMKVFIGLCLCMGILRLPCRNDYWRRMKHPFQTNFGYYMSRDRFNLIWRYLHLQNNEAPPPPVPDKLVKVRWYLEYLNTKFTELYVIDNHASIDESTIKFKGRLGFRQYMPAKPTKWGIKLWSMCEALTGYLSRFQIYTGREAGRAERGLSFRVVTDLVAHLHHQNLRVWFDNFYTSVELLVFLLAHGIYACGTVRANRRGLPNHLHPKNLRLQKHQYRLAQNNDLSFCAWMDTKMVLVMSNFHNPTDLGHVRRLAANRGGQNQVEVPKMVADYQKYMKGVDLCDQMVGYYILNHRSNKWWRRIFFFLLVASCHNAYVLAKDLHPEHIDDEYPNFQDFIEDIAIGLMGEERAPRAPPAGPRRGQVPPPRRAARHVIEKIFERRKVCVECRAARPDQRAHATLFGCRQCNVAVHLHCEVLHNMRAGN